MGLSIYTLKINNAALIGIVAGIGHRSICGTNSIGGIPAILISIIQFGDFHMVIPIVIMFALIYMLDNSIAQPIYSQKALNMNPITIIALLLVGKRCWVPSELNSIPVATVLKSNGVKQ